jgi:apolipoprotein N-acyltransferase
LYYLRFSWLNAGYVFAPGTGSLVPLHALGVYGIGFALMAILALVPLLFRRRQALATSLLLIVLVVASSLVLPVSETGTRQPGVKVAGVQLEQVSLGQLAISLDRLIDRYPETQIVVLSEFTFAGPVPDDIRKWCAKNHRYLVVGGEEPVGDTNYYNTAFVIDPSGGTAFQQAKSVPIQFFKDGLPAKDQQLWKSPWGNIGICICYDLSYTRVTDRLIRLGAQALIVPTMDLIDWGVHQHQLHARVAPVRAAEYGVPIFRLASSGISQMVDASGRVSADTPVPGAEAMIAGTLSLAKPGSLPLDRIIAPLSVGITALVIVYPLIPAGVKPRKQTLENTRPL